MLFKNQYEFLSNLYPCNVTIKAYDQDHTFLNAEAAYQWSKNAKLSNIARFKTSSGYETRLLGNCIELENPITWKLIREDVLRKIVFAKFEQNPMLLQKLLAITEPIVETNLWNNDCSNICNDIGKDVLSNILTEVRNHHIALQLVVN